MIYFNGYTEDGDARYEGIRSFSITTGKVTSSAVLVESEITVSCG
ncbi:MAG: hypothetical protein A4E27_00733 [Methanobacterium sp. PtaU1.Bin242]|nr:MAG: hypothetical protein A4E27_00733 [Methanobacterium sp. PtaU1.Bin242]